MKYIKTYETNTTNQNLYIIPIDNRLSITLLELKCDKKYITIMKNNNRLENIIVHNNTKQNIIITQEDKKILSKFIYLSIHNDETGYHPSWMPLLYNDLYNNLKIKDGKNEFSNYTFKGFVNLTPKEINDVKALLSKVEIEKDIEKYNL